MGGVPRLHLGCRAGLGVAWGVWQALSSSAQPPTVNRSTSPASRLADAKPTTPLPPTAGDQMIKSVPPLPANAILPVLLNYSLWNNSLMQADVQMNGKVERCILDTGLSACAVTPDAAARLKANSLSTQGTITTLNDARSAPEVAFSNIQFNQLKLESLHALAINAGELYTDSSADESPALWLGTPFLAAFQVTFDYSGHYISLDRPDAPLPKAKGLVTLPLEIRNGRLFTKVSIPKGGSFLAFVNTGTIGTLIPAAVASKLKIKPTKTFNVKWGGDKRATASLITLPNLQLGHTSQQEVPVLYFEPDENGEIDRTLGVLGADVLSHYKVILNIAHKRISLVPPPPPTKTEEGDSEATPKNKPTTFPKPNTKR